MSYSTANEATSPTQRDHVESERPHAPRRAGSEAHADMEAIVCSRYGPPDVAELRLLAKPVPAANELLVRVRTSAVGPADVPFRSGRPWFPRLYSGLRKPKLAVLGSAFAGEVEAAGSDVHLFESGTRVFGLTPKTLGTHAEYVCLPEDGLVAPMSPGMAYDDAVSVLDAATGLTFLRDVAGLESGQRLLVNGASGAVGCFAVQLAKHFGAHVTAVCSTGNIALVESLGADEVVDYTREDFTASGRQYDVIFDAVGTSSFARCKGALAPKGRYLTTVPAPRTIVRVLTTAIGARKKAKFAPTGLMQTKDNLALLAELFESGAIRPVIDRRYPLAEIADAYRYVETGRKKGTAVITV
jgi:NADPH:quinone reductase-like Zn-dependent oxidoreductase